MPVVEALFSALVRGLLMTMGVYFSVNGYLNPEGGAQTVLFFCLGITCFLLAFFGVERKDDDDRSRR